MNVTREVVTDLLPVYFSGEASADTRVLVEDYFRGDPDFERIARSAARPLDALRAAPSFAPESEREKRDLECVRGELQRRKWYFGLALFFTLVPFSFFFTNGHIEWQMFRNNPWEAVLYWCMGALFWIIYFARPRRNTASLLIVSFLTMAAVFSTVYFAFTGWSHLRGGGGAVGIIWGSLILGSMVGWFGYFRRRLR
jgi:hypothetical protein